MTTSLREKKKLETSRAIYLAASELFNQYGYQETTLGDIAQRANVSQRTIFSYYSSKEAIIFGDIQSFIDSFISSIEQRGHMSVLDAMQAFADENYDTILSDKDYDREKLIIATTPALQSYLADILSRLEKRIVILIAQEQHFPRDSIQAHMVAACIRAILSYRMQFGRNSVVYMPAALRYIEGGLRELTRGTK